MKKIVSLFLIVLILFMICLNENQALADEIQTPSGIDYSDIGDALDEYVKKYEAGLASCEVAVYDRNGITKEDVICKKR
ncbi:MAG: hypothetical protein MJ113_05330 [Lachnospiraceae bacterium]|nr:hypothetical protein [Lachnospiraceae bacterium]